MLSIQKELASRSLAPSLRVVLASPALRSLRRIPTRGFASRRSEQKTKDSEGQGESAQSEEESWMNFIATEPIEASVLVESNLEEQLRADVLQRLSDEVPPALLEALRSAEVKSFETNRCKIEAQIRDGGVSWHLEVRAERRSFPLQWQLTNMQVRTGRPSSQKGLPPQTRDWKPQEEHLEWTTVAMSE
eukprot:g12310.t1